MIITLPENFPLSPVNVQTGQKTAIASKWRNWVLHLSMFINNQVIANALSLFMYVPFDVPFSNQVFLLPERVNSRWNRAVAAQPEEEVRGCGGMRHLLLHHP